jgi:two-component system osmolarity sensor histidine kinase EnvZ
MKLWPRSLLWRTFLLLALLVVLTTVGWFQIFRFYEAQPRARQIAQSLVSIINLTRSALVNAQPDKRRELLLELSDQEGIQVYPAEPGEAIVAPPDRTMFRLVSGVMRGELGEHTRFAVQRDGRPGFWISFRIEEDEYWLRVPRERVDRPAALQWLGWGLLALVLSLLAAYYIVSRVSRPLKTLSSAAGQIGKGRKPEAIAETGPEEIQTVARAFNQMSQDLARLDADRALILAGVSHDLRTPLARLRLGLEMSGGDPQLHDGMTADIEEMDRIINQFLDFARVDGGEARLPVHMDALAAELVEQHARRGTAISADLRPVPELALQPMALRRVVHNLLDNALRYGERDVGIATREEPEWAVLEVLDRGPGIPPEEAERLKQPFTRLDEARSSDKGGSGLGLAIVDRVVQQHGGRFELVQRAGGGLIARIMLPLRTRPSGPATPDALGTPILQPR